MNERNYMKHIRLFVSCWLLVAVMLTGCFSSAIKAQLNEALAKQKSNQVEIDKNNKLLADASKNAEELKKQITSLNEQNKVIDTQRKALATQMQEIIKIKDPGSLLNVFQISTLRFDLSLNQNIASQWFWAIFWFGVLISILTEILGLWLIAWPKWVISLIPMIIVFPLALLWKKADIYCGGALAIFSWGAAHIGWTMLINWFKLHVVAQFGLSKVLSPSMMNVVNKFGSERKKNINSENS